MRAAFLSGDDKGFAVAAVSFEAAVRQTAHAPSPAVELLYNRINPFSKAKILYGLAALLALLLVAVVSRRRMSALALALVCGALVPHTFGLVARSSSCTVRRSPRSTKHSFLSRGRARPSAWSSNSSRKNHWAFSSRPCAGFSSFTLRAGTTWAKTPWE